jgi:hypothetical protein
MTLNETLLQKLAEWRRPRDGRHTLPVADETSGWAVNLTVDRYDDLSCALWEITVQRTKTPAATNTLTLENWAKGIAAKVTGLLEPLQVVEIDPQRAEALIRSNQPTRRGEALYYYELLLKGTRQALVRRYQAPKQDGRREQIPFTLTHEVLAKFAADLTVAG